MAREIPGFTIPLEASADLSASQFCAVISDANGRAAVAGAGVHIIGVLQNKPASLGAESSVMVDGVTKMVAGAALTVGGAVKSDASGRAINAVATDKAIGFALTPAAAAGELTSVLLKSFTA